MEETSHSTSFWRGQEVAVRVSHTSTNQESCCRNGQQDPPQQTEELRNTQPCNSKGRRVSQGSVLPRRLGGVEGRTVKHSFVANSSPPRPSSAPAPPPLAGNCQVSVQNAAEGGCGAVIYNEKHMIGFRPHFCQRAPKTLEISCDESSKGVSY